MIYIYIYQRSESNISQVIIIYMYICIYNVILYNITKRHEGLKP